MSGRGRVCFFSEWAYPIVAGMHGFAGGVEVLVALLGRGLARRGFDVSVATCDFGQPEVQEIDALTFHRAFRPDGGVPVLRFFYPRLPLAIRALARADAEVYYVVGSGMQAGLAHDMARARRAAFVLHAASDYDVGRRLPRFNLRDRWWYVRALRDADLLFAQTEFQRRSFRENHRAESVLLPNAIPIPATPVDAAQDGHVMWLGTYKSIKRPEWFVRLAREYPGRRFVMSGVIPPPPLTREHWESARSAARDLPNLEVRGFQSAAEVERQMRGASLLVHTSPLEGFSNVMLEAWALGIPTVSSVDPDGLVERLGIGAVATEYPALVEAVGRMMTDPEARRAAGARARAYVTSQHAESVVIDRLAESLDTMVAKVRRRRGTR